ncbi:hypothetical protein MBLNU459_g2268t1 [Dothideomycetes sp. NU459]
MAELNNRALDLDQGAWPPSSTPPEAAQSSHGRPRSSVLSRSKSQRFSFSPLTDRASSRQSYVQANVAHPPFGDGHAPGSSPASPEVGQEQQFALDRGQAGRTVRSSSVPSIYSTSGNEHGEPLTAFFTPGQLLPQSSEHLPSPLDGPGDATDSPMTTNAASTPGKSSSDSTGHQALDRWSQRRLQRLNTEQGFREQRQGLAQGQFNSPGAQQQQQQQAQAQTQTHAQGPGQAQAQAQAQPPHPSQAPAASYYAMHNAQTQNNSHSHSHSHSPYAASSPPSSASPGAGYHHDAPQAQQQQQQQQQYSPPDPTTATTSHRQPHQSRSFTQPDAAAAAAAAAGSNTAATPTEQQQQQQPKARSAHRHSLHNTNMNAPASNNAQPSPMPQSTTQSGQAKDVGRSTPQLNGGDDMSEDDINQLIRDHKELREKYTKVKKYYFEKEDQVKSLQNSLAHQRISQSRTSLDDSEYSTRFNRLDGLIAQLSFSIRKSWTSVPSWLAVAINKDAIALGRQEMTAAGRAIISQWLVDDVFDKYFHPDIDAVLSEQLKTMQKNIRRFAPPPQSHEDEEYLTSKVVTWRLTTLEGLQELLRSPAAADNRAQLTDLLKHRLMTALQSHLDNPPMSDLDGGVHMIIELAVAMISHLPQESRDVHIEYFHPGTAINYESMKPESGIPALNTSLADDLLADHASLRSANSDLTDATDKSAVNDGAGHTKRGMLSALTGGGGGGGGKKRESAQGKHAAAGGSSSSLTRPDITSKDESRVRMAVGIAAHVRGRTVLVKAPVFVT